MDKTYIPLNNENSTDRTPGDGISPLTSAANNPFEKDPDDSTDITADFDDAKAREIESTLPPN